ncbi:MAG TPA: hypothetical protein VIH71_02265 [Solirubrobacteraceae bacterium]
MLPLAALALLVFLAPAARAAVTIESFSAGAAGTIAGGHTDVNTSFQLRTLDGSKGALPTGGEPQDIIVTTPPGLVGDLRNIPECPRSLFSQDGMIREAVGGCPADTQVGEAALDINSGPYTGLVTWGVYNIQPSANEPALLGIQGMVAGVVTEVVPIFVSALAQNDYALTATVETVPRIPFNVSTLGASVTLWGVPASHYRRDGDSGGSPGERAGGNREYGTIAAAPASQWKPFMENPTACATTPVTELSINTYEEPTSFSSATATSPNPTDCATVPFAPSIKAEPDTDEAGAPAGLDFELAVPQSNRPDGRGSAELEKALVTLPEGMTISPSAASKLLEACTNEQFAAGSNVPAECPAASVIGEDEVESPLVLSGPLKGKVYLGQPLGTDPTSGQMFRIFQELQGFGLDIKLQGSVVANPETGQLTATFSNLPELPFQSFRMRLDGGPNAVLVNPQTCGANTTTAKLYPYSGNPPATPSSTFTTSDGGNACPASLPFSVQSAISSASPQAGALSRLSVTFNRADETQPLERIDATLPAGLLGYVSKVALCEPSQALVGSCGAESRIGTVTTTAGAGSDPLTVGGSVYLAHGSNGYPFMLSVVVPAIAGPYDLGNVVVPVWLQVNSNGSLTAVSGSLPSILDGIPLDIRSITMSIDRPGFTVNPTNCGPLSLSGTATSLSGATAALSAPFAVSGCASLPFKPSFTAATRGSTSKQDGASLTVRVTQSPSEADIHSVHVELPKSLPSRLSTLNKACTEQQFAANPAGCPRGSIVGTAVAHTPLLSVPVSGPAILVSHAGAAFPELDLILQGDGITIDLVGNTDIKKGITSSTFATVPDVPISGFELSLPEGPYSIVAANGNLCKQTLLMPTTITGQNGAVNTQTTKIAVTGCPKLKPTIKLTKVEDKGSSLRVTFNTTSKGSVTFTGPGVVGKTVRDLASGSHRLTVALKHGGPAPFAGGRALELRASLDTGKRIVAKTTSVSSKEG